MYSTDYFRGQRWWFSLVAGALLVTTITSCGDAPSDVEEARSAVAGQSVSCIFGRATPPGYPQRTNCQGNKLGISVCRCYPADVGSADTVPYQVVTILRPPPGNMSSITYSSGSTVGSVETLTNSKQSGEAVNLTVETLDIEGKFTSGTVSGDQKLMQTINTDTVSVVQSSSIVDHAYDIFYVWLNPMLGGNQSGITGQLSATMYPAAKMWSATGTQISSAGPDGKPRMQIEPISARALANPSARTPSEAGFFGHLTSDQIAQILSMDDFYGSPTFDPWWDPTRYRYVKTLELTGPEPGSPVVINSGTTIEYDSQNDPIDGKVNHQELTIQVGGGFSLGPVDFNAKFGGAWTWDYTDTRMNIQGVQKAANIVLQTSTTCMHAYVDMYLDLAFGSWVAMPTYTNRSCFQYGYGSWSFDNGDSRGFTGNGDWAVNEFKGECAPNQWGIGVSASADGVDRAHSLLCATTNAAGHFAYTQRTLNIASWNDGYGTHLPTDWDPGYLKGECGAYEVVTGLSQDGNGALDHVRCTSLGATGTSCRPLVFASGNYQETPADPTDWAYGYYKGECGQGSAVAGISRSVGTGSVHAILCCDYSGL